ncbi:hypothetical protein B0H14DRAFT_2608196 [Mycena olivaceomarginata]|nr:hypothetical protein B0H14DRAFT_2608196 [Mycena olivaceomarginata]
MIVMVDGADSRWGSPGYPRISPITGRYVGASGDMSHSSHALDCHVAKSCRLITLTPPAHRLRTHTPTLDNILMQEDTSDNAERTFPRSMYIDDQAQDDTDSEMHNGGEDDDDESMEAQVCQEEAGFFACENLAKAHDQWLRTGGPRPCIPTPLPLQGFARSPTPLAQDIRLIPPAQDMDVDEEEEEEETLVGCSNSEVAARIYDHVSKYLDDQAEDSDEEAEEEHEGDEQEMKEDRDFVDDTAMHNDFVHRLPSSKDDASEVQKWVAHFQNADKIALYMGRGQRGGGGSGEAGAPVEMLTPRELVLYNRAKHLRTGLQISRFKRQRHLEILEDVDVKVHTWVHAPKAFDCRVGFVLMLTDLAVIQDGCCKVRKQELHMSQRWFPRVDPTFADIVLFVQSKLSGLVQHPRQALSRSRRWGSRCGGDRGVAGFVNERVSMARVITPANVHRCGPSAAQASRVYVGATGRVEQIDGYFLTITVPNNTEVVGATLLSTMSNGAKVFIIIIVHATRQWAIGDSLYNANTTFSDEELYSFKAHCSDVDFDDLWTNIAMKLPFAGWSESNTTTNQPVLSALPFSLPDKSQCGFQGIEVMVARPAEFTVRTGVPNAPQGIINVPHKGFIGIIISDFDSQERTCQAEEVNCGKQPHDKSRTGKLLNQRSRLTRIMVTIRGDHSLETVHVPIEHVRHLRQVSFDLNMFFSPILRTMRPLVEAHFFPSAILYGMREPKPPSNPRTVTYRGPLCSDTEKGPAPQHLQLPPQRMGGMGFAVAAPARSSQQSTTPTATNAAVWALQWQPPLEGEDTGLWLCLPELAFKRLDVQVIGIATLKLKKISATVRNCEGHKDAKKVDVCSIGKNGTMHPIDKTCVKPLRTDDEGHPLGETAQRIVVIGPDAEGSSSRPGETMAEISKAQVLEHARPPLDRHYETQAASLSTKVSEAKAVTEGDPTNTVKSTATDYAERFGPSEPETEVSSYIARTRREYQMDELRHCAISDSCPFTNPGPLDAYYEAVAAFDRDFGHKYEATDKCEDCLSTKRKLWDIYKKTLDLPEDRRVRLVGQQAFSTSLQNPFLEHDLCCITFDNKLRDCVAFYTRSTADSFTPTLHCTMIHLVFRNPWYTEPLNIKCIRQYCKYTMWFEELKEMEAEIQYKACRRAPPSPIPTRTFYGAVDTTLH